MPKLIINPDNSIEDVLPDSYVGGVSVGDISVIINNRYGHAVFDYINDEIVLNQTRYDERGAIRIKQDKIIDVKNHGLGLIKEIIPGVKDLDVLDLVAELWQSVAVAARQPTTNFQYAIDVRQAARDAIIVVNAMTDLTTINAYDPVTDPSWPTPP